MLDEGERIDGRYTVVRAIGTGAMATVYLARHETLHSLHAIKVLHVDDADVSERLLQEGRVQAALRHPNVIAVTDAIRIAGQPALVLELVDGPSLADRIASGPVALEEALRLFRGMLAGVAHAHAHGLVHRDLKPANVLLATVGGEEVPKVADFGIVKTLGGIASRAGPATRTGVAMGSPAYMAPEQIRSARSVGPPADIFSLGCILYEMVCGRRAFDGPHIYAIFNAIEDGEYVDPREIRPELPDAVVDTLRACLAVDPTLRPQSCEAVAAMLDGASAMPDTTWSEPLARTEASGAHVGRGLVFGRYLRLLMVLLVGVGAFGGWWTFAREHRVGAVAVEPRGDGWTLVSEEGPPVWDVLMKGRTVLEVRRRIEAVLPGVWVPSLEGGIEHHPLRLRRAGGGDWELLRPSGTVAQRVLVTVEGDERVERFVDPGGSPVSSAFLLPDGDARALGVQVARHRLDVEGRVIESRWEDAAGRPMADGAGAFGYRLLRDRRGRVIERVSLGTSGEPAPDEAGVVTRRYAYGATSPWVPGGVVYEGMGGLRRRGPQGAFGLAWTWAEDGGLARVSALDAVDAPMRFSRGYGAGCAALERVEGSGLSGWTCLDERGTPIEGTDGWAHDRLTRGAEGHERRWTRLDGSLVATEGAAAVLRWSLDDGGRPRTLGPALGADGEPVPLPGTAAARVRFEGDGPLPTEVRRFGLDGEPLRLEPALLRRSYDDRGRLLTERAFDRLEQPTWTPEGWSSTNHVYGEPSEPTETRTLDPSGRPVLCQDGWALARQTFDEGGEVISRAWFGEDGEPVVSRERGCARMVYERDGRGNARVMRCLGIHGEPVVSSKRGYAVVEKVWDLYGRAVEERFYDDKGDPIGVDPLGSAIQRNTWDDRGNLSAVDLFDAEGHPLLGCARIERDHDERNNETRVACFDADGAPTVVPGLGVHAFLNRYDDLDRVVEAWVIDPEGRPTVDPRGVSRSESRYEGPWELPVEAIQRDAEGRPCPSHPDVRRELDARGEVVAMSGWLGEEPALLDHYQGQPYHRVEETLRDDGLVVGVRLYGADQQLARPACCWSRDLDRDGDVVEERSYDADGAPVVGPGGFARAIYTYDARGNRTSWRWYDAEGAPIAREGAFQVVNTFDEGNRQTGAAMLDAAGAPRVGDEGYASWRASFDERGREVDRRFYGADGLPIAVHGHYARIATTWDRLDAIIERRWLDERGQPASHPDGYSRRTWRYDAFQRLQEEAGWDAFGQPAALPGGFARRVIRWGSDGKRRDETRYDLNGLVLSPPDGGWPEE